MPSKILHQKTKCWQLMKWMWRYIVPTDEWHIALGKQVNSRRVSFPSTLKKFSTWIIEQLPVTLNIYLLTAQGRKKEGENTLKTSCALAWSWCACHNYICKGVYWYVLLFSCWYTEVKYNMKIRKKSRDLLAWCMCGLQIRTCKNLPAHSCSLYPVLSPRHR